MIEATKLKNGETFLYEGKPFKVVKYDLQKIGRGGATVKLTAKNLKNGSVEQLTFSSNNKLDDISTSKVALQFLYTDANTVYLMNPQTYEQVELSKSLVEDEVVFLKEGDSVDVLFWDEQPLSFEIAPKINLKVIDTPPGVKGNSASNVYKQATLENGLKIKVPLFINNGELIRVDTRTSEYLERVKS